MSTERKRAYDIILFGVTGFTGRLVAQYFCHRIDHDLKWAIAGRNTSRLEKIKNWLGPAFSDIDCITADTNDEDSIRSMVGQTRVLLTTVGPYDEHGEVVVKACAQLGTDYVDITGEPNFVNRIRKRYKNDAKESGALIVNCCGFDSIPADIGALFTARQLPASHPKQVTGHLHTNASFSGGTWASIVKALQVPNKPKSKKPKSKIPPHEKVPWLQECAYTKRYLVKLPIIDPLIVATSSKTHPRLYGEHFRYTHLLSLPSRLKAFGLAAAMGLLYVVAKTPVLNHLTTLIKAPGTGPSEQTRRNSYFKLQFFGDSPKMKVITEVSGGDPGYTETSKMLSECAILLATKRHKTYLKSGITTPCGAFGMRLFRPLIAAEIRILIVEASGRFQMADPISPTSTD